MPQVTGFPETQQPHWVGSGYRPPADERQVHVGNPADEATELCSRGADRENTVICVTCVGVGFNLHAAVRVEAHDRKRLEQLCRYITRPALSDERVQLNAAGQVELKLKTPWRDGTTHLVMSPLEFMQRLAALVPRPRLHLISLVSA